ncbi:MULTISPECIES: serine/threonine protein kinase [Bacillus cereus group]|uniref:Serine/threonine protein kinase n=1 Tax=Bacillus cereus TaxID=1396 RepID=A0A2A8TWZ2_BACCE|nr:serine/threonine protein kinase [Bacillus cereus]PDY84269.1 serine/threonine protein kinase [Bacillus cereus]PFA05153.1 serine/threonine protein kinase [Bacillus cereus]PFM38347.1 serine/threonine protein kinase [Bacillus cereus]PGL56325.1 serine/threonine protein kinase [Bacillus cereus]PGQ05404.1 serine/threonine protein kinase [Bacillus cereus]
MKRKIIALFVCITIVIAALVIIVNNKESDKCIAVAMYSRGVIVDHNNEPISNVKIYEDSIKSKERAISNLQGEFEIINGVCGKITLQFVTPDGEIYTKKYDSEHIPKIIKLSDKNEGE